MQNWQGAVSLIIDTSRRDSPLDTNNHIGIKIMKKNSRKNSRNYRKKSKKASAIASAKTLPTPTTNPRYGKKSYFFGGEFEVPKSTNNKSLSGRDLAEACCDFAVQCNVDDTHWWVVHKHITKSDGTYTLSINQIHKGRGGALQAGLIMIKNTDVAGMSRASIAKMLDDELRNYSVWLNNPFVCS